MTEHYPEKLGKTVEQLDISHAKLVSGKTYFSMFTPEVKAAIKELFNDKPEDVVLYGLEVSLVKIHVFLNIMSIIIHFPTVPHMRGANCY